MRRRAFTLLEVILVLVILGILIAYAFPDYDQAMRQRALWESADRLRGLILMSHSRAMLDGVEYRIQFPGTPDPDDDFYDPEIDVPFETLQPEVLRQTDSLNNPEAFGGVDEEWCKQAILQPGVRCVAVLPGKPNFNLDDIDPSSPIAGPSITEGLAEFHPLTFRPDGTAEWRTFVLTDLPVDVDIRSDHVARIFNVVVDGRTGQTWVQRAMRVEEVELMNEYGASPILHIDFVRADEITEANILEVKVSSTGVSAGRRSSAP